MKPLLVHNLAGEARRINPLAVVGWVGAEIDAGNGRIVVGTVVAMMAGPPIQVRESVEQFDWLFTLATGITLSPEDLLAFRETINGLAPMLADHEP